MSRVLLALLFCSALAVAQPSHGPVVVANHVALLSVSGGWSMIGTAAQTGASPLRDGDLITRIDGLPAAGVGPLALVNLFDEAHSRRIPLVLVRDGQSLSTGMGANDPNLPTNPKPRSSEAASNGWTAPEFSASDLDGRLVSLAAFPDQWILLSFGATWCGPCVAEAPALKRLATLQKERLALVFLAMNDKEEAVRAFVLKQQIRYPVVNLPDSFSPIPIHYGVSSPRGDIELPVLVLIRPDRTIAFAQLGAADPDQLDRRIGVFLDQMEAGTPHPGPAPPGP